MHLEDIPLLARGISSVRALVGLQLIDEECHSAMSRPLV